MSSFSQVVHSANKLEKYKTGRLCVTNMIIGTTIAGFLVTQDSVPLVQSLSVLGMLGYAAMHKACVNQEKNVAQEQGKFVRNHGVVDEVQKFEGLQSIDKKSRRQRAIVFTTMVTGGVMGAVAAHYLGHPELVKPSWVGGLLVGMVASSLASLKPLFLAIEQKTSLVQAVEERRAQKEKNTMAPSSPKI